MQKNLTGLLKRIMSDQPKLVFIEAQSLIDFMW